MSSVMSWNNKIEVKKGDFGEDIVKKHLESQGYIVYKPITSGPHPFDNLAAKSTEIMIAECKSKPRRFAYPDTGVDCRVYLKYKTIQDKHNLKVFLYFVDELLGSVYGNYLDELDKPVRVQYGCRILQYPLEEGGIRYFFVDDMITIKELTSDECNTLKSLSSRNIDYKNIYNGNHSKSIINSTIAIVLQRGNPDDTSEPF